MAAAVLPPTPRSISFPHNILHDPLPERRSSPRMDQTSSKPSLPSISSLIQAVKDQPQNGSPPMDHQRKHSGASSGHGPASPDRAGFMGSPRSLPPPTPPLPGPSSFDFGSRHSPRHTSPTSATAAAAPPSASGGNYYPHMPGNSHHESYTAPRSSYPPLPEPGQWAPASQETSPREASRGDDARSSTSSYPEILPAEGRYSGMSEQRPLPANFPPPPGQTSPLPPIDPAMSAAPNPPQPWQHHHYYPPANPPAYPPPADRYVCPTCQKPFSRPSSLKIHTYSHTGEKPFKCKHEGCGKFFSVRSNMKRHEKGCHGGDASSVASNSPKA